MRDLPRGKFLAALFLAWSLPLLLATAIVVPPWANSDEPFHMLRAVHVAHGHLLGGRLPVLGASGAIVSVSGGQSDPAIYAAFEPVRKLAFRPWLRLTEADLHASESVKWHRATAFAYFGNTAQYPPVFYAGDAIGYWFGRACGMRVDATLIAARLFNAVLFAVIGAFAVVMARRTRPLLLVVLMLPMSVALGASASQDALMIPICALVVARLDWLISEDRVPGRAERVALAACLAAIGMARPPYALLTLLLIQADRSRAGIVAACAACVATLAWCTLVATYVMTPIGESSPSAQWDFLTAHPGAILPIIGNTFAQSGVYAREFVGRLAWNDTPLPAPFLWLAYSVLLLCVAATMVGRVARPACALLAIGFAVAAIMVLQYFDWTPVGRPYVEGIVGRYFIPLALALGLGLPRFALFARGRVLAAYAGIALLADGTPAIMMIHDAGRFYIK